MNDADLIKPELDLEQMTREQLMQRCVYVEKQAQTLREERDYLRRLLLAQAGRTGEEIYQIMRGVR